VTAVGRPRWILALSGSLAALALAPQAAGQAPSTFSSETDLVVLQVTVFDQHDRAIETLPRDAFSIVEDGAPQTITVFNGDDVPVAVGLVVDNSGSMLTRRGMVLAGLRAFAESSRADDEAFTVIFNDQVHRGLPPTVAFTHNPTLLQSTLARFPPGGKTALHDAVMAGLDHLDTSDIQKRALVVLSDGDDNASRATEEAMLAGARRSNALIYAVSTARLDTGAGNEPLLRRLARAGGGTMRSPRSEQDVAPAFREIAATIHRGYSLGYVPTNNAHDGTYRHVIVRARQPGLRSPRVHVREGYVAPLHDHDRQRTR
jgi:VWFA-related protein